MVQSYYMLELPHVVVGATIGILIPNPAISLPLSLASHFITDYVPHWNPHLNTELKKFGRLTNLTMAIIGIDVVLAALVGFYLAGLQLPNSARFLTVVLCGFLGTLPDLVEMPHFFLGIKIPIIEKLINFQRNHQWNVPLPWGLLTQVIVILLSYMVIRSHSL